MPDRPLEPLLDAIEEVIRSQGKPDQLAKAVQALKATSKPYRDDCHDLFCVKPPQKK